MIFRVWCGEKSHEGGRRGIRNEAGKNILITCIQFIKKGKTKSMRVICMNI